MLKSIFKFRTLIPSEHSITTASLEYVSEAAGRYLSSSILNLDGDGFYAQDPSSSAASEVGRQSHVGTYNKTCLTYPQEENLVLVACDDLVTKRDYR